MTLTREQSNNIKIDGDVIVGFSGTGGDICAEQLARWAYRRLDTWPTLFKACKDTRTAFAEGKTIVELMVIIDEAITKTQNS